MAFDELLADRIKINLSEKKIRYREVKMFGGLCFMVDEKMCIGIMKDSLLARIDPEDKDVLIENKNCSEMKFTGRPMKGFILVSPDGIDLDEDLIYWIDKCLAYNPKAKISKKR